jgi:hypothetical protein
MGNSKGLDLFFLQKGSSLSPVSVPTRHTRHPQGVPFFLLALAPPPTTRVSFFGTRPLRSRLLPVASQPYMNIPSLDEPIIVRDDMCVFDVGMWISLFLSGLPSSLQQHCLVSAVPNIVVVVEQGRQSSSSLSCK